MDNTAKTYLKQTFGIQDFISDVVAEAERDIQKQFDILDGILELNQLRVIKAFQDNRISDTHFAWNTGYGYDDAGRDAVERVYADVFGGEQALVRTNIVNGTHALDGLRGAGREQRHVDGDVQRNSREAGLRPKEPPRSRPVLERLLPDRGEGRNRLERGTRA